jgi:fructosamine-3-kinase
MSLPAPVEAWLVEQGHGSIERIHSVGGGCINNGARIEMTSGESYFLKTNSSTPQDMFAREAEGLTALAVDDGPRVPVTYLHGPHYILMEDLNPTRRQDGYWIAFGRQLASLHRHTAERFGFDHDNYVGSTPQPNPWTEDGHEFFAQHRLTFQAQLASQAGYLSQSDLKRVESLCQKLPDLVPDQPASLIHGDLWSGNAMTADQGEPALIDPAVHYGWAEAELGMTSLFGGFPAEFYDSYEEANPLEPGWRARLSLYNLYHVLNHVNLFGAGYLGQARRILSSWA